MITIAVRHPLAHRTMLQSKRYAAAWAGHSGDVICSETENGRTRLYLRGTQN
jgi:hypothetical protein